MNEDCFEALIWGEQGAEQSLRSTGTVSAELLTQYESAIADLCQDFNGALWPKRLFRILHFASTHLVLRFNVWRTSHANAESSAAGVISEIQFDTAELLWSSVSKLPLEAAELTDKEKMFVDLCFGCQSPVQEISSTDTYIPWKEKYALALASIEEDLRRSSNWSKWVCVALHFAAFYIDLFQCRTIVLNGRDTPCKWQPRIDRLCSDLDRRITNRSALSLIRTWLETCHFPRDNSGLPITGERRFQTGQYVSVRSLTEIFLSATMASQARPS